MRATIVLGILAVLAATGVALAQGRALTPRQIEIVQKAAGVDGSLSREQYDQFWSGFRDDGERAGFRKAFRSELPAILRYQRTLWLAARESSRQHRPIVTPELQSEFERAEKNEGSSKGFQPRPSEMRRSAQALLEGAAYGTPVDKDGRSFEITPQAIEQVLRGLEGSIARLERLLSESWQ